MQELPRCGVGEDGLDCELATASNADAQVPEVVKGPYLHVLENGYYRGKIDELRLVSLGAARPVVTVPVLE